MNSVSAHERLPFNTAANRVEYAGQCRLFHRAAHFDRQFVGPIVLGMAAYVQSALAILCFLEGAVPFSLVGATLAVPMALTTKRRSPSFIVIPTQCASDTACRRES